MLDDIFEGFGKDIVGGVLASAVYAVLIYLYAVLRNNLYRRVMTGVRWYVEPEPARIVYAQFVFNRDLLDPKYKSLPHIYLKVPSPDRVYPAISISISAPVSKCEVRGATYLAPLLGRLTSREVVLASDNDTNMNYRGLVLSLGANSNYVTRDIVALLDTPRQKLYEGLMDEGSPSIPDYVLAPEFEYGIIARRRSREPFGKTRIFCAGRGEWGSSGAAKYLSQNCHKLGRLMRGYMAYLPWVEIPDYLAFVRVRPGDDSSVELLSLYVEKKVIGISRVY